MTHNPHDSCKPGCICTICGLCHTKVPLLPAGLTNAQARAYGRKP